MAFDLELTPAHHELVRRAHAFAEDVIPLHHHLPGDRDGLRRRFRHGSLARARAGAAFLKLASTLPTPSSSSVAVWPPPAADPAPRAECAFIMIGTVCRS